MGAAGDDLSAGTNVLFEVWRVARAADALLADALARAGLTSDEFGIYSVLADVGSMSPTALARWMSAPATTVSSHIKRLEARGHLLRTPDPGDRRAWRIELTPAGRRAFEQAATSYHPVLAEVEHHLGDTVDPVRRSLVALRAAIDTTTRET